MKLNDILQPSENDTLWRYMDLIKFIDLVTSKELTLVNSTLMEDPLEGILHPQTQVQMVDLKGHLSEPSVLTTELAQCINKGIRNTLYYSCWHSSEFESAAMWKLYSNQNGIAIKTSVKRLKESINYVNYKELNLFKVNYYTDINNYIRANPEYFDAYTPLINKRISYEHEKEVRLIWHPRDYNNQYPIRRINVNLEQLIDNIYISPLLDDWQFKAIERFVQSIGLNVVVTKSKLHNLV